MTIKQFFKKGFRKKSKRNIKQFQTISPVAWIVYILIAGSFILAIMDANSRAAFSDLAQVGLCGYIALLMPPRSKHKS